MTVPLNATIAFDDREAMCQAAVLGLGVTQIAMAHALHAKVIAEGVEYQAQLDLLRREGCDEYQGYLCSHAMPDRELAPWLAEHSSTRTGRGVVKLATRRAALVEDKLSANS